MKKISFLFLIIIVYSPIFGQLKFEKGYIIDKTNKISNCYIKNLDWKSPTKIEVKFSETDSSKTIPTATLKEFGIFGLYKYVNRTVKIDRSTSNRRLLSNDKNPTWTTEDLVLKVLIEGKASLYYYEQGDLVRFFYSVSDTIKQLIYKKYVVYNSVNDSKDIYSNTTYRQQIWIDLACSAINEEYVNKLEYNYDELVKCFRNYNSCIEEQYYDYSKKTDKEYFNIKITPGLNISHIEIDNDYVNNTDFSMRHYTSFRFGIESELFLPFYNNKLSVIFEPTYNYFKTTKYLEIDTAYLKYNSIEFPIGLRFYSYLNNQLKIFIDGHYISNYSYIFSSSLNYSRSAHYEIKDGPSFSIGAGVMYNKFSVEFRYYTNRKILSDYYDMSTQYTRFSFIVGYKIFRKGT